MSFFNKVLNDTKEAYDKHHEKVQIAKQEQRQKEADNMALRGELLAKLTHTQYLGGYNDIVETYHGIIEFYQNQIEFHAYSSKTVKFIIPNDNIKQMVVEGKQEVSSRVTVTRMLATGLFAFALKKKEVSQQSYITLELGGGQEVIFFVNNIAPMSLKAVLAKVIPLYKAIEPAPSEKQSNGSVADELAKLVQLKEQGVLTQEEFDAQKARILNP